MFDAKSVIESVELNYEPSYLQFIQPKRPLISLLSKAAVLYPCFIHFGWLSDPSSQPVLSWWSVILVSTNMVLGLNLMYWSIYQIKTKYVLISNLFCTNWWSTLLGLPNSFLHSAMNAQFLSRQSAFFHSSGIKLLSCLSAVTWCFSSTTAKFLFWFG